MNKKVQELYDALKELDAKIQDNLDNGDDHPFNKRNLDLFTAQKKAKISELGQYLYDWLRKQYD